MKFSISTELRGYGCKTIRYVGYFYVQNKVYRKRSNSMDDVREFLLNMSDGAWLYIAPNYVLTTGRPHGLIRYDAEEMERVFNKNINI